MLRRACEKKTLKSDKEQAGLLLAALCFAEPREWQEKREKAGWWQDRDRESDRQIGNK